MLQIMIFNRKRIGDVEKILITDFEKRHNIQPNSDVYNNLKPGEWHHVICEWKLGVNLAKQFLS